MEQIQDSLYPGKIPFGVTNAQAWDKIMKSEDDDFLNHPLVPQFRSVVLAVEGMTTDVFLLTVKELYGPLFSMLAAHKIGFMAGKVPTTLRDIERMFEDIGIVPDQRRKVVVQKLMLPWKLPPTTISTKKTTHSTFSTPCFDGKRKKSKGKKHRNNRG
jgi:hypothetical protein